MKACPNCGSTRLRVLIVLPGGDMVECDTCSNRYDYTQLDDKE